MGYAAEWMNKPWRRATNEEGEAVAKYSRYVGLDVHADSISVSVADSDGGAVRSLGNVANEIGALRKLLKPLGDLRKMQFCYEAGPCGYALYWELTRIGAECVVVAPSLIPQKAGDKVKTDRKDAEKLARLLRAGELTKVWVPDRAHEALRNLVRAREACRRDLRRAQQRVEKLLLREGLRPPMSMCGKRAARRRVTSFGKEFMRWLDQITFEEAGTQHAFVDYKAEVAHQVVRMERLMQQMQDAIAAAPQRLRSIVEALQSLRGIAPLSATIIAVEVGDFARFEKPTQLMSWAGLVPREYSSGGPGKSRRGSLTKSGNAHIRRLLVECAWAYRYQKHLSPTVARRRSGLDASIIAIAEKAEHRLSGRYRRMAISEKPKSKILAAVAREFLGFIWAVAKQTESAERQLKPASKKYLLKRA